MMSRETASHTLAMQESHRTSRKTVVGPPFAWGLGLQMAAVFWVETNGKGPGFGPKTLLKNGP